MVELKNFPGRVVRPGSALKPFLAAGTDPGVTTETPPGPSVEPDRNERGSYEAGSWRSHAAYGLVSVALVAPLFIPGIPPRALLFSYLGLGATVMILMMVWGVIRDSRAAWRRRIRHR